jgi:hypothetical protein
VVAREVESLPAGVIVARFGFGNRSCGGSKAPNFDGVRLFFSASSTQISAPRIAKARMGHCCKSIDLSLGPRNIAFTDAHKRG